METQTRLSRHSKFISAENIVGIFSVSSDDSLHALYCPRGMMRMRSYSSCYYDGLTEFESPFNCTIYAVNVNSVIPQRINRILT